MPAVTTEAAASASAPAPAAGTSSSTATVPVPRDARIMALLLASMGVDDCEPNALRMLLDFAHRKLLPAWRGRVGVEENGSHAWKGRSGGVKLASERQGHLVVMPVAAPSQRCRPAAVRDVITLRGRRTLG